MRTIITYYVPLQFTEAQRKGNYDTEFLDVLFLGCMGLSLGRFEVMQYQPCTHSTHLWKMLTFLFLCADSGCSVG